jgi:hypothetical protein
MDEEPVAKKHRKKRSQDQQLANRITLIEELLNGLQRNLDIMLILSEYGYSDLNEGLTLQQDAFNAFSVRQGAIGYKIDATLAVQDANKAARSAYGDFRKLARIVFKDNATRLALNLNGRVFADRARFLHQARAGYEAALTPEYAPALAKRGYARPDIEAGLALLDALVVAEDAQTAAKAAALDATARRTAAMRNLNTWFGEFHAIAKLALSDHIEWQPLLKMR